MKIRDMNWMQVEALLRTGEDRAVLPVGSVEQHAYLSLAVDALLSEAVSVDAAGSLGVPVFPAQPYGYTPSYMAYPGTMTLRFETLIAVLTDLVESLHQHGFRRVLIVNGHGGNNGASGVIAQLMSRLPGLQLRWYNWWAAPKTMGFVRETDPDASHASWMEAFAITRLPGVTMPEGSKAPVDVARMQLMDPGAKRAFIGDGCYGGRYAMNEETTHQLWEIAVEETREAIRGPWIQGA
jgi:creatinine amidohydrolase